MSFTYRGLEAELNRHIVTFRPKPRATVTKSVPRLAKSVLE